MKTLRVAGDEFTVGVAIPTSGRPRYLEECLASVLGQTRRPDEVVVSDDGGDAEAAAVVARFAADLPIRHIVNVPPLREQRNRRQAFRETTSTFVAMVDDDDAWEQRFLEVTSRTLAEHPGCGFCSTDHWWMDADGHVLTGLTEKNSRAFGRERMTAGVYEDVFLRHLERKPFAFQSTLFRRETLETIGFVPVGSEGAAIDFSIFLELGAKRVPACYVPERLGRYRVHPGQATRRRVLMSESVLATFERVAAYDLSREERAMLGRRYRSGVIENAIAHAHAGERRGALAALGRFGTLGLGPPPLRRLAVLGALLAGVEPRSQP